MGQRYNDSDAAEAGDGVITASSTSYLWNVAMTISMRAAISAGTIAIAMSGGTALAAGAHTAHTFADPAKLEWKDATAPLKGAKIATLHGDPSKPGPFALRLQLPDGFKVPAHWHSKDEAITVLSGVFKLRTGDKPDSGAVQALKAGAFAFMPAKIPHSAVTEGVTILQVQGEGPFDLNLVNPADDPRKKQ